MKIFNEVNNFKFQKTALHIAIELGNTEIVRLLLKKEGIDINIKTVFI